jgi:hypothetical protein
MRWLGVVAVAGMAVAASAWGGGTRALGRCDGTPSWKYVQTLTFVEPSGNVSFTPDPAETYKLVFSGYVKDPNGASLTVLETYGGVEPFRVNGQTPPLYQAALWHRNHPLKDPSAFGVVIQDNSDGKSLDWDGIPDEVARLPGTIPPNEPCNLDSGNRLPGRQLSLTPETFPASYYTGSISIAVYREVFGGQGQPQSKVLSNVTFSGSNNLERATTRPGEKRVWVSVSGSAQLSTSPDGQLQAVGGGSYGGVYLRPGSNPGDKPVAQVRRWRFRIDSVAGPPSGNEVELNGTVTTSGQDACPAEGATMKFILQYGPQRADNSVVVQGGCVGDAFVNTLSYRSNAFVTVKSVGR